MVNMKKKDEFQALVQNLSFYRGDNVQAENFMKKFVGLWQSYGDKKFLGKKGMRTLEQNLQELYVLLGISRDHMEELKSLLKEIDSSPEEMDRIKKIRAGDSLNAETVKFNRMEERYKFMSMLQSVNELMSGKDSKFMKSLDKTLKNRRIVNNFQESIKGELNDHTKLMDDMDKIQLYFETLSDKTGSSEMEQNKASPEREMDKRETESIDESRNGKEQEDENADVI